MFRMNVKRLYVIITIFALCPDRERIKDNNRQSLKQPIKMQTYLNDKKFH